jgi:hypothetical protein
VVGEGKYCWGEGGDLLKIKLRNQRVEGGGLIIKKLHYEF